MKKEVSRGIEPEPLTVTLHTIPITRKENDRSIALPYTLPLTQPANSLTLLLSPFVILLNM